MNDYIDLLNTRLWVESSRNLLHIDYKNYSQELKPEPFSSGIAVGKDPLAIAYQEIVYKETDILAKELIDKYPLLFTRSKGLRWR